MMTGKGMDLLKEEVLAPGLCVACGGCVGLCPHISYFDGKVVCTDSCDLDSGRCYSVCPVANGVKTASSDKEPVGPYIHIHRARAKDGSLREQAQYGGTISTLIITALGHGLIDEAVLTSKGDGHFPRGIIAKTPSEVIASCGSRYTSSAALAAFNKRMKEGPLKCGVVALPCQAQSLVLAQASPENEKKKETEAYLTLGLFCTWALSYREFKRFIDSAGINGSPLRYDIPPPPAEIFQVFSDTEKREVPLADIRKFIQPGCALCTDLTAEHTDISVGAVEGMEGWNTLIVRTKKGKALVDQAVAGGVLEIEELPEDSRNHLFEASLLKRKRGEENRKKR